MLLISIIILWANFRVFVSHDSVQPRIILHIKIFPIYGVTVMSISVQPPMLITINPQGKKLSLLRDLDRGSSSPFRTYAMPVLQIVGCPNG